jgi:ADP-dependent NAD(P)H-hydrate dehydratase
MSARTTIPPTTIPLSLDALRSMPIPRPDEGSDKNSRGRVLVIGSSRQVPGAVLLSGTAALRAGAGKVRLAVPESLAIPLGVAFPESGVIGLPETAQGEPSCEAEPNLLESIERTDTVLFGPGLMDEKACVPLVRILLARAELGLVLDAAALGEAMSALSDTPRRNSPAILTPHAGEMASLTGLAKAAIEADPAGAALAVAQRLGVILALKGATTFIAEPSGRVWRNEHGVVGLGTAGSGDVLAGLIAGLLARGAAPIAATLWGIYVHAKIGEHLSETIGALGFLARDLLAEIPPTLQEAGASPV